MREKRKPKTYGNLLKLADAQGEKLTVQVAHYGTLMQPPEEGGVPEAQYDEPVVMPMEEHRKLFPDPYGRKGDHPDDPWKQDNPDG